MSHADFQLPTNGTAGHLEWLDARRSVSVMQLCDPGPNPTQVLRMLQSAVRVPDHGKRVPWRFVRITGDARVALGELLAARTLARTPDASEAVVEKERLRFRHAPVIVTVVAKLGDDEKIPAVERLLSAGCVCFALLQAAQALGFGACWLTGWAAYDAEVRNWFDVAEDEAIVGFIHIGSVRQPSPERDRPDAAALLTDWTPG